MNDTTTTPPRYRIPALVLVGLMAAYFVLCTVLEIKDNAGVPSTLGNFRACGRWSMFTLKSTWHKELKATALVDGEWIGVDVPALYPTTWESGHRYQRAHFLRRNGASPLVANSICQRLESSPRAVRIYRVRWKRRPGDTQEPKNPDVTMLTEWSCSRRIPMPGGWVL